MEDQWLDYTVDELKAHLQSYEEALEFLYRNGGGAVSVMTQRLASSHRAKISEIKAVLKKRLDHSF